MPQKSTCFKGSKIIIIITIKACEKNNRIVEAKPISDVN